MPKPERHADLIYQVGDLARDRLAGKPQCPPSMEEVYLAEEALIARREEFAALEEQLNGEDAAHREFLAHQAEEREALEATVKKHRKAVDLVDVEVRALRKKLAGLRADWRYSQVALDKVVARHAELEQSSKDAARLESSRQLLKASRLRHLKLGRNVEEAEQAVQDALTCKPGQPGAAGILAHKRLLEMEDEAEAAAERLQDTLAQLEGALADKEQDIAEAEDALDQALYALGEDVYRERIADAALMPFYLRLDQAPGKDGRGA